MKSILVFTTTLGTGGITSCLITLLNEFAKEANVTLAYTVDEASKLSRISERVKRISYRAPSRKAILLKMAKHGWLKYAAEIKLRNHNNVSPMNAIQRVAYAQMEATILPQELGDKYDVAISSEEFFCNNIVAHKINADMKVGWIHPDYKALKADVGFDRKTLDILDYVVAVSKSTQKSLIEVIPEYKNKVLYIPNLIDEEFINSQSNLFPEEYIAYRDVRRIVTVCRIDNSAKRLDRAVAIAKKLQERKENFHWFIVGDGTDYSAIEKLIMDNGVGNVISMLGSRINPYSYIKHADLFVLTSQYEGKPIVIDEALALKCPVLVTNYQSAKEQIRPEYGTVIDNDDHIVVEEFCNALNWSIIDQEKKYLNEHDVLANIHSAFYENINKILNG